MTSSVTDAGCQHLSSAIADSLSTLRSLLCYEIGVYWWQNGEASEQLGCVSYGFCAICLDQIHIPEAALVKGCEHAYCIQTYMQEESVCLLLRAMWFEPLVVKHSEEAYDKLEDLYAYGSGYGFVDDMDEAYYHSLTVSIGNRRWGDNGYVRNARQEARPVYHPNVQASGSGSASRERKQKQPVASVAGRRAKRALKRETADKAAAAAAAKHQFHLKRLGRK